MSKSSSHIPVAVYFDTNSLHSKSGAYEALTNPNLLALREIAVELKRPLCIPEVVADELLDHLARKLTEAVQVLRDQADFIGDVLNRDPLDIESVTVDDKLRRRLRETHHQRLAAQGFEIVPTPELPFARLLAEAVNKIPPFEHGDKGFRDTVIFETVASDASRRAPGSYVLIVSNEKWSPEVLQRLRAHGVDGEVVRMPEAASRLRALLQNAALATLSHRDQVAKQFLEGHRPMIEAAIGKARVALEAHSFLARDDEDDPLKHGQLRRVLGYRIGEVASAYPGLGDVEELRAHGCYPMLFNVAVYFDVVLAEPTLAGLGSYGPVVSLEDVSRVTRLEDEVPLESRVVLTSRTLRRFVAVQATVALQGADEEQYRDLQITRVLPF